MHGKSIQCWRRLLDRRLRRRPLLPFLLAATLAVDAVLFLWIEKPIEPSSRLEEIALFCGFGFCFAQMGLAAIWLVSGRRCWLPKLAVGVLTIVATSALYYDPEDLPMVATFCAASYALQVVLVGLARAGIERRSGAPGASRKRWQYSMAGTMMLMTVTAGVAAASRFGRSDWLMDAAQVFLLCCEATLPAVVYAIVRHAKTPLRAALIVLFTVVPSYSVVLSLVQRDHDLSWSIYAITLVSVLLVWLLGLRVGRYAIANHQQVPSQSSTADQ